MKKRRRNILIKHFNGIRVKRVSRWGIIGSPKSARRKKWLKVISKMGKRKSKKRR